MKIDDNLLEVIGNAYRALCGRNDVLIKDGWIFTFEAFVHRIMEFRRWRGISA